VGALEHDRFASLNGIGGVLSPSSDGFTGRYMYHCHLLEHEDHDMMRPFLVMPAALLVLRPQDLPAQGRHERRQHADDQDEPQSCLQRH
jgi:hypothetical protein